MRWLVVLVVVGVLAAACSSTDSSSVCEHEEAFSQLPGAPREYAGHVDEGKAVMAAYRADAPAEIQDAVDTFLDAMEELIDTWAAADFSEEDLDQERFDAAWDTFFGSGTGQAIDQVDAWLEENCSP